MRVESLEEGQTTRRSEGESGGEREGPSEERSTKTEGGKSPSVRKRGTIEEGRERRTREGRTPQLRDEPSIPRRTLRPAQANKLSLLPQLPQT